MKIYTASDYCVHAQREFGQWTVWFPDIPDCTGFGLTRQDADNMARQKLQYKLDVLVKLGQDCPPPVQTSDVVEEL